MPVQSGFQTNAVLMEALWLYKPDASDQTGIETIVNLAGFQRLTCTKDKSKVYIYYGETAQATTQSPLILEGAMAAAFMADMENLF